MTMIAIPDDQAAGLSLEEWLQQLAAEQAFPPGRPRPHIADVICENMRDVPPETMEAMLPDGASQHDHYIYGWPKKEG